MLRRNYPAVVSLLALAIGVLLPIAVAFAFPSWVAALNRRAGPGVLFLIVVWVGGWSMVGLLTGAAGLLMSFHGYRGRIMASVGLAGNLFFLAVQVANTGIFH
jgi:hypothetical protein